MTDLKNLKPGDSVIYKNVGYGLTSYERGDGDVIEITDGRLYTRTFDRYGLVWNEKRQCWQSEGSLGLQVFAIAADDEVGLAEILADEAEDARYEAEKNS